MTIRCILLALLFQLPSVIFSQPGTWTWLKGDSVMATPGVFGTMGIAATSNTPPAFYEAAEFTDLQGNFWLYSGLDASYGGYGDLWKYTPANNQWTWVNGAGIANDPGAYGTMGVPALANRPPARSWGVASWVDLNGDFWVYGGLRLGNAGAFADMWRYNIASNTWTWMQGSNSGNYTAPVFGTKGVAATANTPGSRYECSATWIDSSGNLWLFGGDDRTNILNDLWMYNISTNEWTWMNGPIIANSAGVYGTFGVGAVGNTPGARDAYCTWKDKAGMFWLLGGAEYPVGEYNDMWKYDPSSNIWTWIGGSNNIGSTGNYGTLCASSTLYTPSSRSENRARCTDNCGIFWCYGGETGTAANNCFNDLWQFNPLTQQWKLVNGGNTSNVPPTRGTMGVGNAANTPGGRGGAISWMDNAGNFYLFGGTVNGWINPYNDLWKFTPDPACSFGAGINQTPFLGNDITYCGAFSSVLSTNNAGTIWSTGDTAAQITVTSPGTYWASESACGTSVADTIIISEVSSLSLNLGPDTSICPGQPLLYSIPIPNANYLWSTGDTVSSISVSAPTTLWARVSLGGCVASDTVNITTGTGITPINLGNDTAYCGNFTMVLNAINPNAVWSTGDTAAQITITSPGLYWAKDSNGCGKVSDSIVITGHSPQVLASCVSTTICASDSAQICATSGFTTYLWNTGDMGNCIYKSVGTYYVIATDANNCTAESNQVSISVYPPEPVSISVNGDTLRVYNAIKCQWYFGGAPVQGDTFALLIANKQGSYSVSVTDSNGCTAFSTAVVISSTNDMAEEYVSVYPNPTTQGGWFLSVSNNFIGTMAEIFDSNGRLVYKAAITGPQNEINPDVARGVYLLKLNFNQAGSVYKLVKL